MTVVGADPEGHPAEARQVVASVELPFTGTLFDKTHPESPWVIIDFVMSPSPAGAVMLCAIDKASLVAERCWEVPGAQELGARMVHVEFNRAGDEFRVSAWGRMDTPTFIAVYDASGPQRPRAFRPGGGRPPGRGPSYWTVTSSHGSR